MKELTIEQKAKAYDEAIERAEKALEVLGTDKCEGARQIFSLFPELKESEDEKIRKDIVTYLAQSANSATLKANAQKFNNWLAWLKKQGQKEYTFKSLPRLLDMIEPTSRAKAYCQKLMNALVKEGYSTDAKIVGECLKKMNGEDVPMAIMDGEPIEVNPTEFDLRLNRLLKQFESLSKEELASSLSFYLNVVQNDGTYKDAEKQCGQKPFDYENANIQQKDFAPKVEQMPDLERGKWYVCDTPRYTDFVVGKAYLCPKNGMLRSNENEMARYVARSCFHIWTIQDAKDGDVLEIGNMIFIYKRTLASHIVSYCKLINDVFESWEDGRTCCEGNKYVQPATKEHHVALEKAMADAGFTFDFEKKELKKIKQNPTCTWSEEDEAHFDSILKRLEGMCKPGVNFIATRFEVSKDKDWLKSIKNRIGNFDGGYKVGFSAAKHNQWKPSDVQMRILSIYADQNNTDGTVLTSLYNDLKKLKRVKV